MDDRSPDIQALRHELTRLREDKRRLEQRVSRLMRLQAISQSLHEPRDRPALMATLTDIIVNIIGAEELAVFELEPGGGMLSLRVSQGIPAERFQRVPLGEGAIGRCAISGALYQAGREDPALGPGDLPAPSACIPLLHGGRVMGVVALFRLLSHKVGYAPADRELLTQLSLEGGRALYCLPPAPAREREEVRA
jgi:GAF domain